MKNHIVVLVLLFSILFFACDNQPNPVTIRGTIKGLEGEMVYAKQINPFIYNSNSLLDSSKIDKNGMFEFKIDEPLPILLNLSKGNWQHPVNQVLQDAPENYYFGYCAMFYLPEPTLYLSESSPIDLDWTVKGSLDSFAFKNLNYDHQDKFYKYYRQENLSEGLYEGGDFKKMEVQKAWNVIEQAIHETLEKYDVEGTEERDNYNAYLYTEIKMGAINMFINWFEAIYEEELNLAFTSEEVPPLYTSAFTIYSNEEWNYQSVEFYKMTERFVTYSLNKSRREFQTYYPYNEEKVALAKKILPADLVDMYITNIQF